MAVLAGMLALGLPPGGARGEDAVAEAEMEVTVWRYLEDGRLYVGARLPGGTWRTARATPDSSRLSASGRFHRSEVVAITAPLAGEGMATVEAVIWQSVAHPSRLHLSVRPEGGRWRTLNAPLSLRELPRRYGDSEYARSGAVTVKVPRPAPPPAVTVTGPLAVFFSPEGETWTRADNGDSRRLRDVYLLDIPTGKYWRAFESQYAWAGTETAGERLVAWHGEWVRRTGLDGRDAVVLFKGEDIREISVSPDGAKVAVLQGSGVLTILSVATGARIAQRDGIAERRSLGSWNSASDAIAITTTRWPESLTRSVFRLDGTLDGALYGVPGELSPDFRHAIRRHGDQDWPHVPASFDVIELASRRTIHSVTGTDATFVLPFWWADAGRFVWFEMDRVQSGHCGYDLRERPPEDGSVTAALSCMDPIGAAYSIASSWEEGWLDETSVVGPRVFDIASGTVREIERGEWYRMRTEATRLSADHRALFYEGRPVWTGHRIEPIGVIDLAEPLALPVTLRDAPRPATPPAPPTHDAMVGPFFAWSEHGGYEYAMDADGNERPHALRRVMVHDAGVGRSWRAFDYRTRGRYWWDPADVLPARGGFVVHTGGVVRHFAPDGRARTLIASERDLITISVSHGGGKAIASLRSPDSRDVVLAVFALPSGEELLRVDSSGPRFEEFLDGLDEYWGWSEDPEALWVRDWNADETAFIVTRNDVPRTFALIDLNGTVTALPEGAGVHELSPDFRHVARGRTATGEPGEALWNAEVFDIVELASWRVVRTVPVRELSGAAIRFYARGWTDDGRFAWSPDDGFNFSNGRLAEDGDGVVWLFDIGTGAVERLGAREYAGRLTVAPERLRADCPVWSDDPFQRCAILLDGEAVGRGQWAEVVGVVALD